MSDLVVDDVLIFRILSDGAPVRCVCGFFWLRGPGDRSYCSDCRRAGDHSEPVLRAAAFILEG